MNKKNVCFIFGGKSPEHFISIESGLSLLKKIDMDKYNVHIVYIKKTGECSTPKELIEKTFDFVKNKFITVITESSSKAEIDNFADLIKNTAVYPSDSPIDRVNFYENILQKRYDAVIPVFHGQYGEDGSIQGLLDFMGIPFVSCGIIPSALTVDKEITKQILRQNDVPVCDYAVIRKYDWEKNKHNIIEDIEKQFEYPVFSKPTCLGSSIGICKVSNQDELIIGIEKAFKYDHKVIIEEAVLGDEYGICFLGLNDDITLSVPGKLPSGSDFLDFKSKYDDRFFSEGQIPANLDSETVQNVNRVAEKVCKVLQLDIWARIDFFINTKGEIIINEVNPIPGMGSHSVFPLMWKASGIGTTELVDRGIELALKRFAIRQNIFYENLDYQE